MVSLLDQRDGRILLRRVLVCSGFPARSRGYLFRSVRRRPDGILLMGTRRIHTMFMGFPIDVFFLDGSLRILGSMRGVPSFRFPPGSRGCRHVLEVPHRPGAGPLDIGEGTRLLISFRVAS